MMSRTSTGRLQKTCLPGACVSRASVAGEVAGAGAASLARRLARTFAVVLVVVASAQAARRARTACVAAATGLLAGAAACPLRLDARAAIRSGVCRTRIGLGVRRRRSDRRRLPADVRAGVGDRGALEPFEVVHARGEAHDTCRCSEAEPRARDQNVPRTVMKPGPVATAAEARFGVPTMNSVTLVTAAIAATASPTFANVCCVVPREMSAS